MATNDSDAAPPQQTDGLYFRQRKFLRDKREHKFELVIAEFVPALWHGEVYVDWLVSRFHQKK